MVTLPKLLSRKTIVKEEERDEEITVVTSKKDKEVARQPKKQKTEEPITSQEESSILPTDLLDLQTLSYIYEQQSKFSNDKVIMDQLNALKANVLKNLNRNKASS